jgi:hypothetical protein
MTHPLVDQLRFARSEFRRGIEGIAEEEAQRRFLPMNCISWNVGHLAWQEQRYWLLRAQDKVIVPELNEQFASGGPASTPPLEESWRAWQTVTMASDTWLDGVTNATLESHAVIDGAPSAFTFGSLLLRTIYHYWYHTGENAAIRQQLGHTRLPDFVGDIDHEAPYRPETER